jgi:hypothetical protein
VNLSAIRRGIANVLDQIDGCRVFASIPDSLAASGVTALIVAPDDGYVTYSEAAGLTSRNDVRMRILIIPAQQAGSVRVLDEIDALLSCGPAEPRSIRTLLGDNISADGTACSVSAQTATVRTMSINDMTHVVGELSLRILARC